MKTSTTTMPDSPFLLVHAGGHKTGSTSIQNALWSQKDRLSTRDGGQLLYPEAGIFRTNHLRLAFEFTGKASSDKHPALNALAAEVADKSPDQVILSAEAFENAAPDALRKGLSGAVAQRSVGAILYQRSPASLILSQFDQRVKAQWSNQSFDDHIASACKAFHRHKVLRRWERAFGPHFTLRPFDRNHLVEGDVVADFFDFLVGSDHETARAARALPAQNTARPAALVLLLDRTKREVDARYDQVAGLGSTPKRKMMRIMRQILMPLVKGSTAKLRWPRDAIETFATVSREGIRDIDSHFFGEPILERDLDRTLDLTPAGTKALTLEEALGMEAAKIDAAIAEAAGKAVRRMLSASTKSKPAAD